MKRIFTFVMAMLCVSMMFAQSNKYEVVGVPAGPEMDRSDWYGWYTRAVMYTYSQLKASTCYIYPLALLKPM